MFLFVAAYHHGFRAVMLYRLGYWLRRHRMTPLAFLCQQMMYHLCHCSISANAEIGHGFQVTHPSGLYIGGNTIIGSNCDMRQNVMFGGNYSKTDETGRSYPTLGNGVSVGAGAVIAGPVKIGSNSIIGANSVVTRDVPDGVIVSGVPAQVIKQKWAEGSGRHL